MIARSRWQAFMRALAAASDCRAAVPVRQPAVLFSATSRDGEEVAPFSVGRIEVPAVRFTLRQAG